MGSPYNDAGQALEVVDAGLNAAQQGISAAGTAAGQLGQAVSGIVGQFGGKQAGQTVTSAVARMSNLATLGSGLIGEAQSILAALDPSLLDPSRASLNTGSNAPSPSGILPQLHDGIGQIEALFSTFGSLLASIRKAHG